MDPGGRLGAARRRPRGNGHEHNESRARRRACPAGSPPAARRARAMIDALLEPAAATAAAAVLGLLVGSFLNVVIHRLPRMLERGWQAQCAELRGEASPRRRRVQPRRSALGVPRMRPSHRGAREHPGRVLACAARQVLGLRHAHFRALPDRRVDRGRARRPRDRALRTDLAGPRGLRIAVDAARADVHRSRYAAVARRPHAAAALGRACS